MVPLASATALGILGGVIGLSLLCLWWLLRAEAREAAEEGAAPDSDEPLVARKANGDH